MRSPILLVISGALACSSPANKTCGAGSNASSAVIANGSGIATSYSSFTSNENHDCVAPNTPAGVVALTIDGMATGGIITLCVPRPDLLATEVMDLANTSSTGSDVQLVDLTGSAANGCTYALDQTAEVLGTISTTGLCGEGSAGYELTIAADVTVDVTCGSGSATPLPAALTATGVAVSGS